MVAIANQNDPRSAHALGQGKTRKCVQPQPGTTGASGVPFVSTISLIRGHTADRRCAAVGTSRLGAMESAGLVLADEAFQVGCPVWWCDPRSCAST